MRVIKPTPITDANLTSSDVAEADFANWNSGATYVIGDKVILTTGYHRIYESLRASNLNFHPATDTSSPPYWKDIGPTNRWAMFDTVTSTATTATTSLTVVMAPGRISGIALLGLVGDSVSVTMTEGPAGPVIYSYAANITEREVLDWYDYFYAEVEQITELVLTDGIPISTAGVVTVTVTGATVAVGTLVVGATKDLGDSQYGASFGIVDYSVKATDAFGATTFVPRAHSRRMNVPVVVDNTRLRRLEKAFTDLIATPAVWIGADGDAWGSLVVYGWYKDFSVTVQYATQSTCNLEIEGLT